MRIFFDNNTSPVLADTINGFVKRSGHQAAHVRDLPCGHDASDLAWFAYLKDTGYEWLVITGDGRIYKNKAQRAAFRKAGLKGFVLAPSYQRTPIHQQAAFLIWRWPTIMALTSLAAPFLFEIPMSKSSGIKQLPL